MPNPVVHFEIVGKNGKKLQGFYQKLFEWTVNANNPMNYGLVDTGVKGAIGGGIGGHGPEGSGGHPGSTFYVEVSDLAATLKKAEKLGGKTIMPPTEIPNMVTFALFADPEGNVVGLVKSEAR
ncbi:MAG: VOC family protein [Chloroflexi bacterium]|nr:VOC family protein [Chloroflexota bacterium]